MVHRFVADVRECWCLFFKHMMRPHGCMSWKAIFTPSALTTALQASMKNEPGTQALYHTRHAWQMMHTLLHCTTIGDATQAYSHRQKVGSRWRKMLVELGIMSQDSNHAAWDGRTRTINDA